MRKLTEAMARKCSSKFRLFDQFRNDNGNKTTRRYSTGKKSKIIVKNPIVEIGGDEMTKIIFEKIKKLLIIPFINLERDYYDCGLINRDKTRNEVTLEAIVAIRKYNVGVKCSTITPDAAKMKEYNLKEMWPSPNAIIRNSLSGTQIREPIICNNINKFVPGWKRPIIICRHPFGGPYSGRDIRIEKPGKVQLVYEADDGERQTIDVHHYFGKGVALLNYNTDESIRDFAKLCFKLALERKMPLYFSTKSTLIKTYDGTFVEIFQDVYEDTFQQKFKTAKLTYEHRLIDDMAAQAIKSQGGFVWALKSYDGDIMSDVVGQGFGSLGLMTHSLICNDGKTILTEPAHGTVSRHYKKHLKGEPTSTNPISSIYAWTRCLRHRATLDKNYELDLFTKILEKACIETVEEDNLTKDLALCLHGPNFLEKDYLTTDEFMDVILKKLEYDLDKFLPNR